MKNVASEALRVHSNQRRTRFHVTHDQSDGFFYAAVNSSSRVGTEPVDAESAPPGRKIGRCDLFDCVFFHPFIIATESVAEFSRAREMGR